MSKEIDKLFNNLKTEYDSGEGDDLGKDFFWRLDNPSLHPVRIIVDFKTPMFIGRGGPNGQYIFLFFH